MDSILRQNSVIAHGMVPACVAYLMEKPKTMKAVILAGGLGTRLSEETVLKPKPIVEICGRPILWHIMKIYSAHGINDFIVCLGYKSFLFGNFWQTTSFK